MRFRRHYNELFKHYDDQITWERYKKWIRRHSKILNVKLRNFITKFGSAIRRKLAIPPIFRTVQMMVMVVRTLNQRIFLFRTHQT